MTTVLHSNLSKAFTHGADVQSLLIEPESYQTITSAQCCVIFWLNSGRCDLEWNAQRISLQPGDCCCIRPGIKYQLKAQQVPLHMIKVKFKEALLAGPLQPEINWFANDAFKSVIYLSIEDRLQIEQHLVYYHRLKGTELALSSLLHALKIMIICAGSESDSVPAWLLKLKQNMQKKECLSEGLPALLSQTDRSQSYLCRQWRLAFNETPTEFINRERVHWAKEILANTDESITSIALHVGFRDLSYFYRKFQMYIGSTPKEYRELRARAAYSR